MVASGVSRSSFALRSDMTTTAAAPSLMPEALRGGVGARVLVGLEAERLALLGGDLDRHDLRLELPTLLRGGRLLLALGGELVLLLTADAVLGGDVLGGDAHVHEGDRAGEAVGDHRVEDLVVPQADAEAGLLEDVGRA